MRTLVKEHWEMIPNLDLANQPSKPFTPLVPPPDPPSPLLTPLWSLLMRDNTLHCPSHHNNTHANYSHVQNSWWKEKKTQKYLFRTELFVEMISFSIESPCLNFVATQWSKVHGGFWTKLLHLILQVYFKIQWNRDRNKFRTSQCRQIAFSEKCGK